MAVANRSKKMTYAAAVAELDALETAFPGGIRTQYSYRREAHAPISGGLIALTIYRKGKLADGEPAYKTIDNA